MIKNLFRALGVVFFMAFAAYSAFSPAHAGSGYGVDEMNVSAAAN
jgi:hypothetical protein